MGYNRPEVRRAAAVRLHDFLDYRARERPDEEFAVQGERRLTYREALAEVNRLARAFVSARLPGGDRLAPREWTYIINDSQARMLIAAGEYVSAADALRGELQAVERFVAIAAPEAPGWQDYRQWVDGQPATPPDRSVSDEDDVYQMYTSGTTGHPKGAVLTHSAVAANLVQAMVSLETNVGE